MEQKKAAQPTIVLALATYHGRRKETAKALQIWGEWKDKLLDDPTLLMEAHLARAQRQSAPSLV